MAWLDALLGQLYNNGVRQELRGGLNITGATLTPSVSSDGVLVYDLPISEGGGGEFVVAAIVPEATLTAADYDSGVYTRAGGNGVLDLGGGYEGQVGDILLCPVDVQSSGVQFFRVVAAGAAGSGGSPWQVQEYDFFGQHEDRVWRVGNGGTSFGSLWAYRGSTGLVTRLSYAGEAGGGTPTLAEVLGEGADADGTEITNLGEPLSGSSAARLSDAAALATAAAEAVEVFASNATPTEVTASTQSAGDGADFARWNHVHRLASNSVTTIKIANAAVTIAKLATEVTDLIPGPSDATPQAVGTGAAGSSTDYSRADHVHPPQAPAAIRATIGSSQNNFDPTGFSTLPSGGTLIIDSTANGINVTGISAKPDGYVLNVVCDTNFHFTLSHNSGSSTAANRILVQPNGRVESGRSTQLIYDGTSARWRVVGYMNARSTATPAAASGAGTPGTTGLLSDAGHAHPEPVGMPLPTHDEAFMTTDGDATTVTAITLALAANTVYDVAVRALGVGEDGTLRMFDATTRWRNIAGTATQVGDVTWSDGNHPEALEEFCLLFAASSANLLIRVNPQVETGAYNMNWRVRAWVTATALPTTPSPA